MATNRVSALPGHRLSAWQNFVLPRFLLAGMALISAAAPVQQLHADSMFGLLDNNAGFALGMYAGYLPAVGEISPVEVSDTAIGAPDLVLFGIAAKYRYHFLFFRAAFDGGIPITGGSGKINNEDYLFSVQQLQVPLTGGLYFPLTRSSALYMGMGMTYANGIFEVKNDLASNTYAFSGYGAHLLLGGEFAVTDSGYITFEWLRTFGSTAVLKAENIAQRELSLNNNNFILGYSYYFSL